VGGLWEAWQDQSWSQGECGSLGGDRKSWQLHSIDVIDEPSHLFSHLKGGVRNSMENSVIALVVATLDV